MHIIVKSQKAIIDTLKMIRNFRMRIFIFLFLALVFKLDVSLASIDQNFLRELDEGRTLNKAQTIFLNNHLELVLNKDLNNIEDRDYQFISSTCNYLAQQFQNIKNLFGDIGEPVIIMGVTGAGKTSLMNWLTQGLTVTPELTVQPLQRDMQAEINAGYESCTTIPTLRPAGQGRTYCDCPGFRDTRGPIQELMNAFYMYSLPKHSKTRVAIVVSSGSFHVANGRGKLFTDSLNDLVSYLPSLKLTNSLSVIISHDPERKGEQHYRQVINKMLDDQAGLKSGLVGQILSPFTQTDSRIGIFPAPNQAGQYEYEDKKRRIIENIATSTAIDFSEEVQVSISPENKLIILNMAKFLNKRLADLITSNVCPAITVYCNNLITHSKTIEEIRERLASIRDDLGDSLSSFSEHTREGIKWDRGRLNKIIQEDLNNQLSRHIELVSFLKTLNHDVHFQMDQFRQPLVDILRKVKKLAKTPRKNDDGEITGSVIGTSELDNLLDGKKENINIFALNTVVFDKDLIEHGRSLAMLSPNWRILGDRKIDLSGMEGLDQGTAPSGIDGTGANGTDGNPGNPGMKGGNFFAYGSQFQGLESLRINVSGGRGGKGQDGGNGGSGIIGKDGDRNLVDTRSEKAKGKDNISDLNGLIKAAQFISFQQETTETEYKSPGTLGSNGGNGGKGGKGGLGGYAGSWVIEREDQSRGLQAQPMVISDSVVGEDGEGGEGGEKGEHGKDWSGTYRAVIEKPYDPLRLLSAVPAPALFGLGFVFPPAFVGSAVVTGIQFVGGIAVGLQTRNDWVVKPYSETPTTPELHPGNRPCELNEQAPEKPIKNHQRINREERVNKFKSLKRAPDSSLDDQRDKKKAKTQNGSQVSGVFKNS